MKPSRAPRSGCGILPYPYLNLTHHYPNLSLNLAITRPLLLSYVHALKKNQIEYKTFLLFFENVYPIKNFQGAIKKSNDIKNH